MLLYHHMLDPYHCSLRAVSLISDSESRELEWERFRVLDFLVTFPHALKSMRVPAEFRKMSRSIRSVPEPYETIPNLARVFYQVAEIQATAMRLLVAGQLIEKGPLERGLIQLSEPTPQQAEAIAGAMQKLPHRKKDWYKFIVECLLNYPLNGSGGLKERTGLMEHRHDNV